MQNDSDGNLWIVEDVGGKSGPTTSHAKQPNSFIYRYVPAHRGDLASGKLQALQVLNAAGTPINSDNATTATTTSAVTIRISPSWNSFHASRYQLIV